MNFVRRLDSSRMNIPCRHLRPRALATSNVSRFPPSQTRNDACMRRNREAGLSLPRMTRDHEQDLDEHLERFGRRLPAWAARLIGWLWKPAARWVRLPVAIVLILAGIVGFLPVLGFWMVP